MNEVTYYFEDVEKLEKTVKELQDIITLAKELIKSNSNETK